MRTLKAIVTPALVVLAAACENGTPDLAAPEVSLARAAASEMVPFKGTFTMQLTPADVGRCGDNELGASITKVGHATHLGRFTAFSTQCFNPNTGEITQGETVFTGANGDQLSVAYSGQVSPTGSPSVFAVDLDLTVTGGTGRFAGASGNMTGVGESTATGAGSASLEGVISSPGSK
jgi:hypothetical protein